MRVHRSIILLLIFLISGDLIFIFLDIIPKLFSLELSNLYEVEHDGSYAELYQYIKELWIIILIISIAIKTHDYSLICWALLFLYLLIDDSMEIHENYGLIVSEKLMLKPFLNLRPQDFGELLISLSAAFFFMISLLLLFIKGSKNFRLVTIDLTLLILVLAFFGVFIDMLHIIIPIKGMSILEDGGEMIVMSFIVSYLHYRKLHRKAAEISVIKYLIFDRTLAQFKKRFELNQIFIHYIILCLLVPL